MSLTELVAEFGAAPTPPEQLGLPPVFWNADREAELKTLLDIRPALSARDIAAEMGVTRNVIIGKTRRMGWMLGLTENDGGRIRKMRNPRPEKKPKAAKPRREQDQSRPKLVFDRRPLSEPFIPPMEQRCSIMELDHTRCRWPIGEPGEDSFAFCGGKPLGDFPYCEPHCRAAYNFRMSDRPSAAQVAWRKKNGDRLG